MPCKPVEPVAIEFHLQPLQHCHSQPTVRL